MKLKSALIALTLLATFSAGAETILKCAVNNVSAGGGARINLLQNSKGELRANLIFGTTVSGTMYTVKEISPGVYEGSIKGKSQFAIRLAVAESTSQNKYIRGYDASLRVIYPDVRKAAGSDSLQTSSADLFVCGKQINSYSN